MIMVCAWGMNQDTVAYHRIVCQDAGTITVNVSHARSKMQPVPGQTILHAWQDIMILVQIVKYVRKIRIAWPAAHRFNVSQDIGWMVANAHNAAMMHTVSTIFGTTVHPMLTAAWTHTCRLDTRSQERIII